jgi:Domain of unknown function (DUF4129)
MVTGPPRPGIRHAADPGGGPGGPGIGRDAARQLARHELAKPVYHQHVSLIQRILDALSRLLGRLHAGPNAAVPGGWWTLIAVMALAVIVAGIAIARLGPVARPHRRRPILGGGQQLTATQHRLKARRLAAAADWPGAIRAILRAIAGELEERAILPPRAGRTADELAAEAAAALPGLADPLWAAAALFDDVCYGERPGTPGGYAQLNDLDDAVRSARAVPPAPVTTGGGHVGGHFGGHFGGRSGDPA